MPIYLVLSQHSREKMLTAYLIGFTILGGLLACFAVAGWSSYSEGKLPATHTIFRWFLAGITASGLSAYVWLFGAGGDPGKMIESVTQALDVSELVESISLTTGGAVEEVKPQETVKVQKESVKQTEITVGMPNF